MNLCGAPDLVFSLTPPEPYSLIFRCKSPTVFFKYAMNSSTFLKAASPWSNIVFVFEASACHCSGVSFGSGVASGGRVILGSLIFLAS